MILIKVIPTIRDWIWTIRTILSIIKKNSSNRSYTTVDATWGFAHKSIFISPTSGIKHRHTLPTYYIEKPNFKHTPAWAFQRHLITIVGYVFQIRRKRAKFRTWKPEQHVMNEQLTCWWTQMYLLAQTLDCSNAAMFLLLQQHLENFRDLSFLIS